MAKVAQLLAALGFAALCGCTQKPAELPDTRAADEAAVRKADADWVVAAQAKSVDAWVAFYSPDAVVLPPNEKLARTSEDIRQSIGAMFALPGLDLHWAPAKVEVSRSGDLAYSWGAYELKTTDSKGNQVIEYGKNVEIWKKQPDKSWKCIVDTWNSNTTDN